MSLQSTLLSDNVGHWWRFRESSYPVTADIYDRSTIDEITAGTNPDLYSMVFSLNGTGSTGEITPQQPGPSDESYSIHRVQDVTFNAVNNWNGTVSGTGFGAGADASFSYEGWFKFDSLPPVEWDVFNFTNNDDYIVLNSNGSLRMGRTGVTHTTSAGLITANNWHYIAVVNGDPSKSGWTLYVDPGPDLDPILDNTLPGTPGSIGVFTVGSPNGGQGSGDAISGAFNGYVSEVAMYNYPLTATQVRSHYLAALGNSIVSLDYVYFRVYQ